MPSLSLLNPWVIIGLILLMAGVWVHGDHHGTESTDAKWMVLEAQRDQIAQHMINEGWAAKAAVEGQLDALKTKSEKDHAEKDRYISGMRIANGRLVAAHGGLYDKNGRTVAQGDRETGGGTQGSAGVAPDAAPGCVLSDRTSENLLDLTERADHTAEYAGRCQLYATGLHELLKQLPTCRLAGASP